MSDIIRLLPDNVANQIAAGEVVQRPASVVKELMENAIDAGADHVQLIIKEAGKTLIQVIDNGCGMSEADARMAFERHATSKIRKAEDIFAIHTKGFRGEALASIAAVAQVDLKTRQNDEEIGTHIRIEGGKFITQEYCSIPVGTHIEVKNLFFNIPARRNFLKSNNVELRHIIDEFEHVALAHQDVSFTFVNNGSELFNLPAASLRQRIVNVFGNRYNEKLVPLDEETPIIKLSGFIGKPEFSKKTRGEQFFFANNRYIRNGYLHKAVLRAFEGLISEGYHPSYFIFLEIDPARIDVNIHPTKTEIKFDDDKAIHSIIRTAVKHALGQYNIAPSLDFESDVDFMPGHKATGTVAPPGITIDPDFNPFESTRSKVRSGERAVPAGSRAAGNEDWQQIFQDLPELDDPSERQSNLDLAHEQAPQKLYSQVGRKYIITNHSDGLIVIHQHRAHERILFEKIRSSLNNKRVPSQQLLFPQAIQYSSSDYQIIKDLFPRLREVGFDLDEFGKNEIVVNGIPLYLENHAVDRVLEQLLEDEKDHRDAAESEWHEMLANRLAEASAIPVGNKLTQTEMAEMVDELFACQSPYLSTRGKPVVVKMNIEDIDKSFD
jgi:DNA mismatch repair protein MutL